MGKGIITAKINEEGLYIIDYMYNTAELDKQIIRLTSAVYHINTVDVPRAQAIVAARWLNYGEALDNLNQAIAEEKPASEISAATKAKLDAAKAIDVAEDQLNTIRMTVIPIEHRIKYIQDNKIVSESVSAWCADYNIDLSIGSEVGVMEFPGEGAATAGHPVVIRPAGTLGEDAVFIAADGLITQSLAMTSAAWFFNDAMKPAWQRWQPIYRLGTMGLIDSEANRCIVFMDNNGSSYKNLDTIPEGSEVLTDVPVEYMTCDSAAFETGDRVIVKFDVASNDTIKTHGNYTATVIGFESNPKACPGITIIIRRGLDNSVLTEDVKFQLWDSEENSVGISYEYNTDKERWEINLSNPTIVDPEGYWLDYNHVGATQDLSELPPPLGAGEFGGVLTQYPYVYKEGGSTKGASHRFYDGNRVLLAGETLEDTIHYLAVEYLNEGRPYVVEGPLTGSEGDYFRGSECEGLEAGDPYFWYNAGIPGDPPDYRHYYTDYLELRWLFKGTVGLNVLFRHLGAHFNWYDVIAYYKIGAFSSDMGGVGDIFNEPIEAPAKPDHAGTYQETTLVMGMRGTPGLRTCPGGSKEYVIIPGYKGMTIVWEGLLIF